MSERLVFGWAAGFGAVVLALGISVSAAKAEPYLRAGIGYDWSSSTTVSDRNCAATEPPALFGCALGEDGRPIGARGDFGGSPAFELGAGYRVLPGFRVEAQLAYHPDFAFSGNANFLATPQPQPVSAKLDSITGMVAGYLDLTEFGLPRLGPAEPFVGAGLGITRHRLSRVTYGLPGLGTGARTVVQGGTSTQLSYMLTAGAALPVSDNVTLDLAYRYLDLGTVKTDPGPAEIRRASTVTLDIAGTEADLTSHGVTASLRIGF